MLQSYDDEDDFIDDSVTYSTAHTAHTYTSSHTRTRSHTHLTPTPTPTLIVTSTLTLTPELTLKLIGHHETTGRA